MGGAAVSYKINAACLPARCSMVMKEKAGRTTTRYKFSIYFRISEISFTLY